MLFDPWELISLLKFFFLTYQQLTRIGKENVLYFYRDESGVSHVSYRTRVAFTWLSPDTVNGRNTDEVFISSWVTSLYPQGKDNKQQSVIFEKTVTHSKLSKTASCVFVCFWVFKSAFVNSNVTKWARKCQGPHHDLHLAIFTYLLVIVIKIYQKLMFRI